MGGGFESNARPCFHEKTPADFEFQLFPEDWPHFGKSSLFAKSP